MQRFYARTSSHGYETCVEHLCMAGCLAGGFAHQFDHRYEGLLAGMLHDLGKYSEAFQRMILDPDHRGKVDHSTAGAMLLGERHCVAASMAVAGHHAGLADVGTWGDLEGATYLGRMRRAKSAGENNPLKLAGAWEGQLDIPEEAFRLAVSEQCCSDALRLPGDRGFSDMMLTRMLLSVLVDGDRLDAEFFVSGRSDRAEYELLKQLKEQLSDRKLGEGHAPVWNRMQKAAAFVADEDAALAKRNIARLADIMEDSVRGYFLHANQNPLNEKRCELLRCCLSGGGESRRSGLYTLTAPTGSGKTLASMAFALNHARRHGLHRIIYVIPYMSIIDQTVDVLESLFGADAVLPHYSEASYQLKDESDMDESDMKRALASENWNAPIVVTTAVQFFESLYSNRTSRCRKLHRMANSVIVFDEAQTLPQPYLRPCVRAIAELVQSYGSTAVLCTATQPELRQLFEEFHDSDMDIPEISPFTTTDMDVFQRVYIERIGHRELDELAESLQCHQQVLCVVNTRKEAQYLYARLCGSGKSANGVYCLTTLQCASDRKRLLHEIRANLVKGVTCRVVSTSLIEAGVDVDFPVVYREEAGLDSILQSAGRCNREGKHTREESKVYVFSADGGDVPFLRQNIAAYREVAKHYPDLTDTGAVHEYFRLLMGMRRRDDAGNDPLDKKGILGMHMLESGMPFARVSECFKLIDTSTVPVYIPCDEDGESLCRRLLEGDVDRRLFRRLGKYAVNVWPQQIDKLQSAGAVVSAEKGASSEDECFVLREMGLYTSESGLRVDDAAPDGIFW